MNKEIRMEVDDELYKLIDVLARKMDVKLGEAAAYVLREHIDGIRQMCREGNEIALRKGYLEK